MDPALDLQDSTPGWHRVLRTVLRVPGMDKYGLVSFSIFALFLAFTAVPLLLLKRSEAWGVALLIALVSWPLYAHRLALGRPYLVTSTAFVVISLSWQALVERPRARAPLAACAVAAFTATYLHSTWYMLMLLPFVGLVFGHRRAALALAAAVAAGVLVGAIATLQPITHLTFQWELLRRSLGVESAVRVSEMAPFTGDTPFLLVFLAILLAREGSPTLRSLPWTHVAFTSAGVLWVGGFVAGRAWMDFGLPAFLSGLALLGERFLERHLPLGSMRQLLVGVGIAVALFLAIVANHEQRWDANTLGPVINLQERPDVVQGWLPDPGGVLYAADMNVFFTFFFAYPNAPWRYALGQEPGLMRPEDKAVVERIWGGGGLPAFLPWVDKLRPEDRLILNLGGRTNQIWPERADRLERLDAPGGHTIFRVRRPPVSGAPGR